MSFTKIILSALVVCGFAFAMSECSSDSNSSKNPNVEYTYPEYIGNGKYSQDGKKQDSIFGEEGFVLFGGSKKDNNAGVGIGVNSFLWRATLDTLAFLPFASADPFGGVIITDWYTPPETPKERFKVNAFIMTKALRADGIKVTVFKQELNDKGVWVDAALPAKTATAIEDAILVRAREIRIAQMPQKN